MFKLSLALRFVVGVAISVCSATTALAFGGHNVGGKYVHDVFADSHLAAVADAACRGDVRRIEREVAGGVDVNTRGLEGFSLLHWAVTCQNAKGVEALLKAGADPNYSWPDGSSATVGAASWDNTEVLKLLLRYGGNPNGEDLYSHKTALMNAMRLGVFKGKWDNYYYLLDHGADINHHYRCDTIETFARIYAQFDKMIELLDRGCSYDLNDLGRLAQIDGSLTPEARAGQERLRARLEKAGVKFPVPPGPCEDEKPRMLEARRRLSGQP